MAVVIGEAAVAIRADASGTAREIEQEVGPAAEKAGADAGDKLGAKMAIGIAAAGAAVGAGFAESLEQSALGDKLAAQLGASGDYAADLGEIAGSLYSNAYGEGLGDVNDALRSVIQSGAVMEDASNAQLESVTASALDLASAFDVDVGDAANAAGRLVQTGLADNAEQALDIITRGFQQGADKGGDFLDVLSEYGTTFTEIGIDGPAAVGLIDQALAAGIPNADFAADALREIGIRGREGSEAAADALGDLGLNAQDYFDAMRAGGPQASAALDQVLDALRNTEDPALRASAATELVGTQYEDLGDAILAMDPSAATDSLGQIEGAAGRMGETLNDNASTNMTTFMRTAQQAFVDVIGGQVIPIVESIVGWLRDNLGPALETVGAFINDNVIPPLQSFADWLGQNEPLVTALSYAVGTVLVAALAVWGTRSVIEAAKSTLAWFTTAAASGTSAATQQRSALQVVAGWIMMGVQALAQGVKIAAVWTAQVVASAVTGAASFAAQVARVIAGWVLMAGQAIVQGVIMAASFVASAAAVVGAWALMGIQSLIRAAQMAAAWIIAMGPIGWIIAAVVGLVALIIANWDKVKAWTIGAFQAIWGAVTGVFRSIVSGVSGAIGSVVSFVSGLPGKILAGIGNLGSLLLQKGKDLIQGLVNGISAAASFVGNVARNIVNGVIGFVNDFIIDGINDLLEFTIAGIHINPPDIPHIPRLHEGGEFYSAGGEGLAILRSGELVATPEQRTTADTLLGDLLAGRLPDAGTAGAAGAGVSVVNNITQQPGEDGGTLAARITQGTVWNLNTGATRRVGARAEVFA